MRKFLFWLVLVLLATVSFNLKRVGAIASVTVDRPIESNNFILEQPEFTVPDDTGDTTNKTGTNLPTDNQASSLWKLNIKNPPVWAWGLLLILFLIVLLIVLLETGSRKRHS